MFVVQDISYQLLRGNTSAGRNFWPGQNLCLQAEISAWNSGLEKTSQKFRPGIPSQNSKPKFQDRIVNRTDGNLLEKSHGGQRSGSKAVNMAKCSHHGNCTDLFACNRVIKAYIIFWLEIPA